MTVDGTTKLADFSLARSLATRLIGERRIMGTLHYMAPEMILGEDIDGRADLYALGVMLYEMTTGQVPFDADDPVSILSQHLYAPVVPSQAKNSDIPAAFDYLIVRLLAKRPENRPASAAEVLESLEQLEVSEELSGPFRELSLLDRIVRGRLVGREQELGDARELWNQTCSGQGQLLLISGEPGVGKTRLVHELVTQARATGGISLVGASYADGGSPYEPFRQILREALRDFDSSDGLPDGVLADLLKVSPELRLQYPDVPANPPADPQDEQRRLLENMVILFSALSDRASLLIVLEDCHWADGGTRMLLRHLARNTRHQRLMIAITYREAELRDAQSFHKLLLDFSRERLGKSIQLNRLDREETNQLLSTLFDEEITPDFLDGIFRETEGNPFYIEEVCKALVESGRLAYKDGRWARPSIDELGIPQSIQVAVQSRVRALPDETQQMLDQAAILGREFDLNTLRRAAGICEANLIEALEEAERAQLIEEASPNRGRTFGFVHVLIPAALIAALRALRRRRLHLQAAVALETTHPEAFEALAYQYMEGGEIDKGMTYLVRAGDRARAIYAHQEAINSYQQALEHLKERGVLEQAARTLMKLGLTYHNAFEFHQARQAYQEGFALWQQVGGNGRGSKVCILFAE
jgi:predicted ATPase